MHVSYHLNIVGTDYVVGDVHGEYDLLIATLEKQGFDYEKDRLFALGDLIDRGKQSMKMLQLLDECWFFSVLGNHEDMFIERFVDKFSNSRMQHILNGGNWANTLNETEINSAIKLIESMPWDITLKTKYGYVGLVHAAVKGEDWDIQIRAKKLDHNILWSIHKPVSFLEGYISPSVINIDKVVSGHYAVKIPIQINNHWFIDTLYESKRISLISVNELFK